jgi:hypothetical protein
MPGNRHSTVSRSEDAAAQGESNQFDRSFTSDGGQGACRTGNSACTCVQSGLTDQSVARWPLAVLCAACKDDRRFLRPASAQSGCGAVGAGARNQSKPGALNSLPIAATRPSDRAADDVDHGVAFARMLLAHARSSRSWQAVERLDRGCRFSGVAAVCSDGHLWLLPRDSGRQTATPPSCGRLLLSALVLAAERIAASGPGRRTLPPGAALEPRASDVPRLPQGPRWGPPETRPVAATHAPPAYVLSLRAVRQGACE